MPPLNNFVFDEPAFVPSNSINDVRSDSPSSFERGSDCEDLRFQFAYPPLRQKSVSFNHHVEVEYIPSHRDWAEDEIRSRWNSNDDYTNFQLDIFNTIYLLRNDPEAIDETSQSARGVEGRDPISKRQRRLWKRKAWDVILEQQNIRRKMNTETSRYHYLVASMYSHVTQVAMRSAIDFAAQDEIDARNFQSEDNHTRKEEIELFNDSWISTVCSSYSESSSISNSVEVSSADTNSSDEKAFGFHVFGAKSEFDNSWLTLES